MFSVTRKAVWGAAVACILLMPATSRAHDRHIPKKLDAVLLRLADEGSHGGSSSLRVIITAKKGAEKSVHKRIVELGGRVHSSQDLVHAVTATVRSKDLRRFAQDDDIKSISVDADVSVTATTTTTTDSWSTISDIKQALGIGNWFAGSSVTVAVIDSGIAPLTDFNGRIVGFFDFTAGKRAVASVPFDDYGHGTHVAGLIGSSGVESNYVYAGVANNVKLLVLKALDNQGGGKTSDVINAIQFAVANKDVYGIKVINLSLGHPIYESAATDPLVQAVERAVRAGIVVVAAAGNYGKNPQTGAVGYAGIASPGNAPSALTVGSAATFSTVGRQDDRAADYSSRGPSWYDGIAKPDVLAPGDRLLSDEVDGSTLASTYPNLVVQSGTKKLLKLSGSSMATGVVSGLVAVMIEANQYAAQQRYNSTMKNLKKLNPFVAPVLSPNAIKAMLQFSATALHDANGVTYDLLTQGTGLVNGLGAVELAYYTDETKPISDFWLGATFPYSTQFGDALETWSQDIVWGTKLVSGPSLAEVNQNAWSRSTVWGAGELDNVVWGTVERDDNDTVSADCAYDIVWGTSIVTKDVVWSGSVNILDDIVWGTTWDNDIVWGTGLVGFFDGNDIVWGTMDDSSNVVWGTLYDADIVWSTSERVIVLGTGGDLW